MMGTEYGVECYDDSGSFLSYSNRDYETARKFYMKQVRNYNCGTGIVVEFSVGTWSTRNWKYGKYEFTPMFRFEAPDYRAIWRHRVISSVEEY